MMPVQRYRTARASPGFLLCATGSRFPGTMAIGNPINFRGRNSMMPKTHRPAGIDPRRHGAPLLLRGDTGFISPANHGFGSIVAAQGIQIFLSVCKALVDKGGLDAGIHLLTGIGAFVASPGNLTSMPVHCRTFGFGRDLAATKQDKPGDLIAVWTGPRTKTCPSPGYRSSKALFRFRFNRLPLRWRLAFALLRRWDFPLAFPFHFAFTFTPLPLLLLPP